MHIHRNTPEITLLLSRGGPVLGLRHHRTCAQGSLAKRAPALACPPMTLPHTPRGYSRTRAPPLGGSYAPRYDPTVGP